MRLPWQGNTRRIEDLEKKITELQRRLEELRFEAVGFHAD